MRQFIDSINKSKIRNVLAVVSVIGILVIIILLFFVPIPKENNELLHTGINQYFTLGGALVFAYYFGSSKNETDRQITENAKNS